QDHVPALGPAVEMAVRDRERSLARTALPDDLARLDVHALQAVVELSVDVVADHDRAAVVVLKGLFGVDLRRLEARVRRARDLEAVAADRIAAAREDEVVLVDRGGADRRRALAVGLPQELA